MLVENAARPWSGRSAPEEASSAVGKRWSRMAWSMLAVFAISMVCGLILAVANGTFQQDAGTQLLLFLGFSASWSSGP
jgi:hypothetical protein